MLLVGQRVENKVVFKEVEEMPSACRKLGRERELNKNKMFLLRPQEEEVNSFFKDAEIVTCNSAVLAEFQNRKT